MIPFSSFSERASASIRMVPAYSLVGFLFLIGVVSISYPLTGLINAPFFLMALYYWSIYRPTLLPRWLVFILGCSMDFLSGFPIGLSAVLFLIIQWIVTDQRKFLMAQSFMVVWFGFLIVSAGTFGAQWVFFSLLDFHAHSIKPLLISSVLGAFFFPIVMLALHFTHKFLPSRAFQLRMRG